MTTRRVLTLGFIHGRHLPSVPREEIRRHDTRAIARDLLTAYLKQMVVDGVFHCDPHPGNIFLTDEGKLALMDFGMVGRFDSLQKDYIILLLLAFAERQGSRVADTYLEMVEVPKGLDRRAFTQDVSALVSRYHDLSGSRMAMGTALLELTRLGYRHRAPVPGGITLLGKAMLNLDGTVRALSPDLDPVGLIRDYMLEVMQKRIAAGFSPGRLFAWVLDVKHLAENTPRRADLLLDKLANDQFTLRFEVQDLETATRTLNRAAARLSLSLVASSLIVAGGFVTGALLRRRDTPTP
jgi:predicted unusual protein kinase regulating ubiquinone biosynthesis (AarF/ABC1/UbiB family)